MALITCPDCNNSVSDSAPSCPHCGRPMKYQLPPVNHPQQIVVEQKKKTSIVTLGCAVLAGIALLVFIVGLFKGGGSSPTTQSLAPGIGQQAVLNDNTNGLVYVAKTEAALDALLSAIQAKDKVGFTNALMQTYGCKQNTKVLVIDRKMFKRKVRILEGEVANESGWVPDSWVKPAK